MTFPVRGKIPQRWHFLRRRILFSTKNERSYPALVFDSLQSWAQNQKDTITGVSLSMKYPAYAVSRKVLNLHKQVGLLPGTPALAEAYRVHTER